MASFTISDKYEGNTGHVIRFAAILKVPSELAETWLTAVKRGRHPLQWSVIDAQYWTSLNAIRSTAEVLQVKDQHLQEWPNTLFACKPLEEGKTVEETWGELRQKNQAALEGVSEALPDAYMDYFEETSPKLLAN